jgi:peroxiredoxin
MEQATHSSPTIGAKAPDFHLPSAGGGNIALSDFVGRKNLLLWFSKGLACPFCRRNMARLSQAYSQFQSSESEILQITHNTMDEASLYFRNYHLATPYLCDPDRQVHMRYGIPLEEQTIGAVVGNSVTSCLMVTGDLLLHGQKSPSPVSVIMRMGPRFQSPQLVVVVDRAGVVRHVQRIGPFDTLPTVAQLLSLLEPLRSGRQSTGRAA